MTINHLPTEELQDQVDILRRTVADCGTMFSEIRGVIIQCFQGGNQFRLCSNGGNAVDTQHVTAEFINRFRFDRSAFPAVALTTDRSTLTCCGNNSSFDS